MEKKIKKAFNYYPPLIFIIFIFIFALIIILSLSKIANGKTNNNIKMIKKCGIDGLLIWDWKERKLGEVFYVLNQDGNTIPCNFLE